MDTALQINWRVIRILLGISIHLSTCLYGQERLITGYVTDDKDGMPLPGVNVLIEAREKGTTTNFDGFYQLNAQKGDVLTFSSLSFKTITITVGGQTTIDVALSEDVAELDQVLVIGYQRQSKREISGSISQVKSDILEKQAYTNFGEGLQGQLAGVNVQAQSGAPGGRVNIQIRGVNSLSSTGTQGLNPFEADVNPSNNPLSPLYVVDGVPFSDYPNISAAEIESIEVLKDAATAAVYGSRASAGVIIISTKKAEPGPISVKLSTFTAINRISPQIPLLNANEFIALSVVSTGNSLSESFSCCGILVTIPNGLEYSQNWQETILNNNAITTNYNAKLYGGSEIANFSLIVDHVNQDGVFINSDLKRTNARLNSNITKDKFHLFSTLFFSTSKVNTEPFNFLYDAIKAPPIAKEFTSNQFIGSTEEINRYGNFLYTLQNIDVSDIDSGGISFQPAYEIFKGLKLRLNLSANKTLTNSSYYNPPFRSIDIETGNVSPLLQLNAIGRLIRRITTFDQIIAESILDYSQKFGQHKLSLLAGYTVEERELSSSVTDARGFSSANIPTLNQATDRESIQIDETKIQSSLIGLIGTIGYNYRGKYAIRANIRRDGSSRFLDENRFGWFWGASGAWTISDEPLFESIRPLSFIDNLKFRYSFGKVGNQSVGDYLTTPTIGSGLNYITNSGESSNSVTGINETSLFNKNLKWETSISQNIGLDISMFNRKVNIVAELYEVKKEDLLFNLILPPSLGSNINSGTTNEDSTVPTNIGELTNKGIEITAGYKGNWGNLFWNLNGTYTRNISKITKLNGATSQIAGQKLLPNNDGLGDLPVNFGREGFQAGAFFLVPSDGLIKTQEELDDYKKLKGTIPEGAVIGDLRLVDANQDGIIDMDSDRVFKGNNSPDFEIGINLNLNYKNFDFSMSWFGSFGSKIYNAPKAFAYANENHQDLLYSYRSDNTESEIPILREGSKQSSFSPYTDLFLENGDYVRLRNLQLGYSLPKDLVTKLRLQNFRIYIGGSNVLTFTEYSGYDPEVGGDGLLSRGLDRGLTPITGSGRIGFEIEF